MSVQVKGVIVVTAPRFFGDLFFQITGPYRFLATNDLSSGSGPGHRGSQLSVEYCAPVVFGLPPNANAERER